MTNIIHENDEKQIRRRRLVYAIIASLLLLTIYALISFVNHYNFRTYAYDLGFYNKVVHDYSLWNFCDFTLGYWRTDLTCPLGDHFDPIFIIIGPLRFLFGTWTLLIVQIGAIVFGAFGVFKFVSTRTKNEWVPAIAMLHFGLLWGNFAAVSYDFHTNVLAAMFIPWFFHFFLQKKFKVAALFFLLALLCKENVALWLVMVGLGLALAVRKDKVKLFWALGLTGFAVLYFLLTINVFIPAFANSKGHYHHLLKYKVLGGTFKDMIIFIFTDPLEAIKLMFVNHSDSPGNDFVKVEMFLLLLWSGGVAILLRPAYLVMIIPIILQKVWHDLPRVWGVTYQYSIEFVPIIALALYEIILNIKVKRLQVYVASVALLMTIMGTWYWYEYRIDVYPNPKAMQFYSPDHYEQQEFNAAAAREAIGLIPDDAAVSSQSIFVPHLAQRRYIYLFPRLENAEYVITADCPFVFPLTPKKHKEKVAEFVASPNWEMVFEKDEIKLFRKRP